MVDQTFVVFDLETTGPNTRDEILEVGAVKIEKGQITETFEALIKPKVKIPLRIKMLTGIDEAMVAEARELEDVLPEFREFIGENPLVAHNISFDYGFLVRALGYQLSNQLMDTVDLARIAWPIYPNHRLTTLSASLNINHYPVHRALGDARAAGMVLLEAIKTIKSFEGRVLTQINKGTDGIDWPYSKLFFALETESYKSFPNLKIGNVKALEPYPENSLFLSENDGQRAKGHAKLDLGQLENIFGEAGTFVSKLPNYEYRFPQIEMVKKVGQAFNDSKMLLMEAGTGTGKSLAYLVPSMLWASANQEKVVIATHTINLQEQLWEKDIPLLKKVFKQDFQACIVKGKNNYICLRKWFNLKPKDLRGGTLKDSAVFWARICSWLEQTLTGDRSQLNFSSLESEWWQLLAGDSELCLGFRCPYFQKSCFVVKARQQAEKADILVVNHSLLLSDIKTDNHVLPPYQYLIVDEGHHLEDEATNHLGYSVGMKGINRFLGTIARVRNNHYHPGFVGSWKLKLDRFAEVLDEENFTRFGRGLELVLATVAETKESADILFDLLGQETSKITGRFDQEEKNKISRVNFEDMHEKEIWLALINEKQNLLYRLKTLVDQLKDLGRLLEANYHGPEIFASEIKDLQVSWNNAQEMIDTIEFLFTPNYLNYVYWAERAGNENTNDILIKAAPVTVGQILYDKLLKEKKSIVFTSATLTVDNNFEYFAERIGVSFLNQENIITCQVNSPFDYERQALLCLIKDLPNPAEVNEVEFSEAIIPVVDDLVTALKGSTLVLFTSHKMLREVYYQLRDKMEEKGICLLGHGIDGSRSQLLAEFQERPNTVLFGANSFWEGVDIPGDALKCVIIVKIPFAVPTLPTVQARIKDLQRKQKDGFKNFSLPQAIIQLKQGFGRLIRTRQDHGVVVVLDRRVISKSYGRYFLRSLPLKNHFRGEQDMVVEKVVSWLKGEGREQPKWQLINSKVDVARVLRPIEGEE